MLTPAVSEEDECFAEAYVNVGVFIIHHVQTVVDHSVCIVVIRIYQDIFCS